MEEKEKENKKEFYRSIYTTGKGGSAFIISIPKKMMKERGWRKGDILDVSNLKKVGHKIPAKIEYTDGSSE